MRVRVALVMVFLCLAGPSSLTFGKSQPQSQTEGGGSIAGRVTLGGTPVPGALVLVRFSPPDARDEVGRCKTDAIGRYRVANLQHGRYSVLASALPLTSVEERDRYGREIILDRGETRENVDFSLGRGGAITGRISEASGQPIVEEQVSILELSTGKKVQPYYGGSEMMITDDRGVYRVFGLAPGRYKISVGVGAGNPYRRLDQGQTYYPLTFHPDVADEYEAAVVELTEGAEVSGVDIVVGARARTFEASGHIVDSETGQPQPGINWGYGGNAMSSFGTQSDANGAFKITGLRPGRYSVFAGCEGDYYMDQIGFDVTDHDVTGLEIRRHRGASISGRVVVDGVSDPAALSKLNQVSLRAGSVGSRIDPDGSYYFCGLRPGRAKISVGSWPNSGFWWLQGIERDGVNLRDGIDVSPGDHVTGVRIVLAYGTGFIRGQVTVTGDDVPEGVRFRVYANRLGEENRSSTLFADADERGRFVIEGLMSGEYELSAGWNYSSTSNARIPRLQTVTQRVTVTNGAESAVTLVVKAADRPKTD